MNVVESNEHEKSLCNTEERSRNPMPRLVPERLLALLSILIDKLSDAAGPNNLG
jgi:hypothetical protein